MSARSEALDVVIVLIDAYLLEHCAALVAHEESDDPEGQIEALRDAGAIRALQALRDDLTNRADTEKVQAAQQ